MALLLAVDAAMRRNLRRDRIFRDRFNPLDNYDDDDLMKRFRMPRHVILEVIDLIEAEIEHPTQRSHAIPSSLQVLCALRYFATGNFQFVSGDLTGISQSSVSRIVTRVSAALANKSQELIKFPMHERDQQIVKEGFFERDRHRIPNVLGCLDGSLIPIKAPSQNEDAFVCRKRFHAINVQGVCNHQLKFTNLVVKWPGSTHDAFMWNTCRLYQDFENGHIRDGILLGDSAYPLQPWLITPIPFPENASEEQFNEHHRRVRNSSCRLHTQSFADQQSACSLIAHAFVNATLR